MSAMVLRVGIAGIVYCSTWSGMLWRTEATRCGGVADQLIGLTTRSVPLLCQTLDRADLSVLEVLTD